MYWSDWGSIPKIEKAEMTAGKARSVIVSWNLHWPNGLTLDHDNNRLYWVDGYNNNLEYFDVVQGNRRTLISSLSSLPHPFGLTVLGDYLYWTDWQLDAIYRANKDDGGELTSVISGLGQPMDIHGYNLTGYSTPGKNNFPLFC